MRIGNSRGRSGWVASLAEATANAAATVSAPDVAVSHLKVAAGLKRRVAATG